jgi:hypothetical protein
MGITGGLAGIRTEHLPNASLDRVTAYQPARTFHVYLYKHPLSRKVFHVNSVNLNLTYTCVISFFVRQVCNRFDSAEFELRVECGF